MASPNAIPIPRGAFREQGAAQFLNVSRGTVRNLMRAGKLRSVLLNRSRVYPVAELERLLAGQTQRAV